MGALELTVLKKIQDLLHLDLSTVLSPAFGNSSTGIEPLIT